MSGPRALCGSTLAELERLREELGELADRARQVFRQVYVRHEADPGGMSDLPARLRSALADRCRTGVPEVVKVSWVEKYPGPRTFDGAGPIVARFEGDIREFTFPKSPKARFLVVNERFHPYWKAFARGRELPIEKVNAAMSGIEVPAGVTRVTAEFRPFATQWPGYLLRGSALIVLILGCLLLSFGGWVRFLRS